MNATLNLDDPTAMKRYLKAHENDAEPLCGENQYGEPVMVSACNGRVTVRTEQSNGTDRVQTWYEADGRVDEHVER